MVVPIESDEVHNALQGAASVVRGLLSEASRSEVLARHNVGSVLRDLMKEPGTYGNHAVEHIAAELGVNAATLYRHVAVAESWSAAELLTVSEETNRFGQPLSWSHFVVLAKVSDANSRRVMLEECLSEAWSVRELSIHINERAKRNRASTKTPDAHQAAQDARQTARVTLEEGLHNAARATAHVSMFAEALAARAVDATRVDEKLLARTIAMYEELVARVDSTLATLAALGRRGDPPMRVAGANVTPHPLDEEDDLDEPPIRSPQPLPPRRR